MRSIDLLRGAVATLPTLLLAVACSSAVQTTASTAQPETIDPDAGEHESHLILQLPTDACAPGATCAKVLGQAPALYVDGVSVALGANTRLKPGTHNVAVNNVGWQVTTSPDQNLTVTLPVAERKCTNAALPTVPQTDFGETVTVSNAACPTTAQGSSTGVPAVTNMTEYYYNGCSSVWTTYSVGGSPNCGSASSSYGYYYINSAGACTYAGTGYSGCVAAANAILTASAPGTAPLTDAYEAYVPGTLSVTVNGAAQNLTLNAGDEVDFNIDLPVIGSVPSTFATNIKFLDPRANPDAASGTITSNCGDRSYTIPSATGTPAPLALSAFVNSSCTYTLSVGGRTQTLSQTGANNISLNRLDVNDVTITREDGSKYTVKGTYTLNYGGVQVAGPYSTGTGVDVLPGTYQFSLSFTDFDGPQTQTQTLTF